MKTLIVLLTILPYLVFCLLAWVGHLLLCLGYWKRPSWGMWRDQVFLYGRFLRDILIK